MTSGRALYVLVLLVPLLSLSGCASFRSGGTHPPASWPISKGLGKQSISLLVTGEGVVNNNRQDIPQRAIQIWQEAVAKAYKDSGLFSNVTIGAAETDLKAEIHILDRGEASMGMAFLSGLTLTLVPVNARDEIVVTTTLKGKEGQEVGTYNKKETVSTWIQLFLIFIMPFNWPNTVAAEMLYDLNRAIIDQAHAAKAIRAETIVAPRHWAHVAPQHL
jgi:hypothetical protein